MVYCLVLPVSPRAFWKQGAWDKKTTFFKSKISIFTDFMDLIRHLKGIKVF